MEHICSHEKDFQKLYDAIFGNGKPGLKTEIEIMKKDITSMKESLESMASSLSALAKSQIEYDITEKLKIQYKTKLTNTIKLVGIIFGIAIPLTALIINLT